MRSNEEHEVHPRHVIHFWNPETEHTQDLLEFLRSEVIKGREKVIEVRKISKLQFVVEI